MSASPRHALLTAAAHVLVSAPGGAGLVWRCKDRRFRTMFRYWEMEALAREGLIAFMPGRRAALLTEKGHAALKVAA